MLSIDWIPNPKDSIPLYLQIKEYIKNKIATGEWPINSKLPPQRTLARMFQVNRSTLTIALDELVADGLLESKLGSGTWVANNTWSLLSSPLPINWTSYLDKGIYLPNLNTIQEINHLEFNPKLIRLGTGELSPEIFPKAMMDQDHLDFSFSGLKSAVLNYLNSCKMKNIDIDVADVCASFQHAVVEVLKSKAEQALVKTGYKTLVLAGGVAANSSLRASLGHIKGIDLYYPPIQLCTDNAAMIAITGYFNFQHKDFCGMEKVPFSRVTNKF